MFVGMQVFGLELNVANIVVLPLILGIGVDTSVHIMHRVREEERLYTQASLSVVILGTGRAVLFAALTTMVDFAGLTVADNGAMKSLGFLMVLAILSTLGSSPHSAAGLVEPSTCKALRLEAGIGVITSVPDPIVETRTNATPPSGGAGS